MLQFSLRLLPKDFERIMINNDVLECYLIDDRNVRVTKEIFLKAIQVSPNPDGFKVIEPTT